MTLEAMLQFELGTNEMRQSITVARIIEKAQELDKWTCMETGRREQKNVPHVKDRTCRASRSIDIGAYIAETDNDVDGVAKDITIIPLQLQMKQCCKIVISLHVHLFCY